MRELVDLIRSDHAALHAAAAHGPPEEVAVTLRAHREFLEAVVAPLVEDLGPAAVPEWREALTSLDDAVEAAEGGDGDGLRRAVDDHAEQVEQTVLARLLSEADEGAVADRTASAMQLHESLGLGTSRPPAQRAATSRRVAQDPRPAGADEGDTTP